MQLASNTDINNIMEIINEVVREMSVKNNTQWDALYPQANDFLRDIENKSLYVLKDVEELIGIICLDYNEPVEYKNVDWQNDEKALVLHRMAINPKFQGMGYAKKMMLFADELAKKVGVSYIRTDTYSLNESMNGLFKACGYQFKGNIEFRNQPELFNCYIKRVL